MKNNQDYIKVSVLCITAICILTVFAVVVSLFKGEEPVPLEVSQAAPAVIQDNIYETFLILNETTGKVEEVDAFDYVVGAVMAEMPPSFHIEALKAQALCAYTRASYLKKQFSEGKGEFTTAHFSQNPDFNEGFIRVENAKKLYGDNFNIWYNKMEKAALFAVEREISYDGEPIIAAYHAMSAGSTENSENVWGGSVPYLQSVDSDGDRFAPDFETEKEITFSQARKLLVRAFPQGKFPVGFESEYFKILKRSKGGYVTEILVGGEKTDGCSVRKALDLRSACFSVKTMGDSFVFSTSGYGHGVGFSQVGADFMARQGFMAEEILEHYYKGAVVKLRNMNEYND